MKKFSLSAIFLLSASVSMLTLAEAGGRFACEVFEGPNFDGGAHSLGDGETRLENPANLTIGSILLDRGCKVFVRDRSGNILLETGVEQSGLDIAFDSPSGAQFDVFFENFLELSCECGR